MPRMYHRPLTVGGRKAMLATPAYAGVAAGYAFALAESVAALERAGIAAEVAIFAGDCHVDDARNRLVRQFLKSTCTDLVFLDADIRWEADDLVRLLKADRDVVAATYPLKQDYTAFPVQLLDSDWSKDEPLEVAAVPTGFLRIRRNVLERLAKTAPHYSGKKDRERDTPLIFERTLIEGVRYGGDYTFCHKWRLLGGKIHLLPDVRLEHFGERTWTGSFSDFHDIQHKGGVMAGLDAIRERRETPELLSAMIQDWGNPWSVTPEFLAALVLLARETAGPILECGSGITTLAMAAASDSAEILALEHDSKWHTRVTDVMTETEWLWRNVRVVADHLENGWYRMPSDAPRKFSLAVVDGPPRDIGDRAGILSVDADVYLFDDANSPKVKKIVEQMGGGHVLGEQRPFAIVDRRKEAVHAKTA